MKSASKRCSKGHRVKGYTRKDGIRVKGHCAKDPRRSRSKKSKKVKSSAKGQRWSLSCKKVKA